MTNKLIPFDIADLLDSEEAIAEYLSQVLADGDTDELLRAIGHVAKAKGIAEIADVCVTRLIRHSGGRLGAGGRPTRWCIRRSRYRIGRTTSQAADRLSTRTPPHLASFGIAKQPPPAPQA